MAEAEGIEPSHAFATWLQFSKLTHYRSVKPPLKMVLPEGFEPAPYWA